MSFCFNKMNIHELYKTNEQIRAYINAFAIHRNISIDEAMEHLLVKEYVR